MFVSNLTGFKRETSLNSKGFQENNERIFVEGSMNFCMEKSRHKHESFIKQFDERFNLLKLWYRILSFIAVRSKALGEKENLNNFFPFFLRREWNEISSIKTIKIFIKWDRQTLFLRRFRELAKVLPITTISSLGNEFLNDCRKRFFV